MSFLTVLRRFAHIRHSSSLWRREYSSIDDASLQQWKERMLSQELEGKDEISPSQFNLFGNTLNDPVYQHDRLPTKGTELPQGWHFAYFPPRVPEHLLAPDGYEQDWKPPTPFVHRMWASGEMHWSSENPLRVGDTARSVSSVRDISLHTCGRRGDTVFVSVDNRIENERGWAATETRCWAYVKDQPLDNATANKQPSKQVLDAEIKQNPDFSVTFTPSPVTLFRFSALSFNSHRIHYDSNYAKDVEHLHGCLVHGPLSFTLMLNSLRRHLYKRDTNSHIESFSYRCYSPLVVNYPLTVCGKQQKTNGGLYDLWVLDHSGQVAVAGKATLGFHK